MAIRTWGIEIPVNTTTVNGQMAPAVAALQDGGYVIAWVDDRGTASSIVKFQRFDAFGTKVGAETTVPSMSGNVDQDQISICTLASGNFVIANRDFDDGITDVTVSLYSPTGGLVKNTSYSGTFSFEDPHLTAQGTGFRMDISSRASETNKDTSSSNFDANGNFLSTFAIDDTVTPVTHSLHTSGTNITRAIYVDQSPNGFESLLRRNGDVTSGYLPDSFELATVFGHISNVKSVELSNAATGERDDVYCYQTNTSLHVSVTGNVLRGPDVYYPGGADGELLALPDHTFLLLWRSLNAGKQDIHIQQFDSACNTIGAELLLNSTSNEEMKTPAITMLADGRLLATWADSSGNSDGSGSGINQQFLDPREGIVTGSDVASVAETLIGHDALGDIMRGLAGNDTIYGLAGTDVIHGGNGDDQIYGGRGDDTAYGGNNNDRIYGDLGDDEQYGDAGSDVIYSGRGSDLMDGGTGSDTVYYASEKIGTIINLLDQTLNAGSADGDTLLNFETIFGSATAADNITGGNGNETILGGGGNDVLNGSGGIDFMRGGTGADTLNGGLGNDKFQYTAVNELGDTIINYEAGDDFTFIRTSFGNLAGANVADVNFLSVATGHAATTINHRFIFDQALDQLWYDADGTGATAAVMVADLSNNINVTNLDLQLL